MFTLWARVRIAIVIYVVVTSSQFSVVLWLYVQLHSVCHGFRYCEFGCFVMIEVKCLRMICQAFSVSADIMWLMVSVCIMDFVRFLILEYVGAGFFFVFFLFLGV